MAQGFFLTLVIVVLSGCLLHISHASFIKKHCAKCVLEAGAGYYRVPGYCNIFAHCSTSTQDLETCPPGTFFHDDKCRHAADVSCEDDPCRKRAEGYTYSDGVYCYGYYACEGGRSIYKRCAKGEGFDGKSCVVDNTCKQYSWMDYGSGCPPYLSPCPGDTSKFYLQGAGGIQHQMLCPRGLNFNPDTCICDWGFSPPSFQCSPMFNFRFNGNTLDEFNQATLTICGAVSPSFQKALFEDGGHAILWMMDGLDLGSQFVLSFEFKYLGSEKGEVALMGNDYKDDPTFTLKMTYDSKTEDVIARIWLTDDTKLILSVPNVAQYDNHKVYLAKNNAVLTLQVDDLPPIIEKHAAGVKIKNSPLVIGATSGCIGLAGYMDNIRLSSCPDDVANPKHQHE